MTEPNDINHVSSSECKIKSELIEKDEKSLYNEHLSSCENNKKGDTSKTNSSNEESTESSTKVNKEISEDKNPDNIVKEESPCLNLLQTINTNEDKQMLSALFQFLKKHNLKETEELFKKEANIKEEDINLNLDKNLEFVIETSNSLSNYKNEQDPSCYDQSYQLLINFIETCLDVHKCELSSMLYPVFVHTYLELVFNNHSKEANNFFHKFKSSQESYHEPDLLQLSIITRPEQMLNNQLMQNYRGSKFTIRMLRDSYTRLKRFLNESKLDSLASIISDHLLIDVFDGSIRNKNQIDLSAGALLGDIKKDINRTKIFYGLLKEPDVSGLVNDDEEEQIPNSDEQKPSKKRKTKKDSGSIKKSKNDPNALSNTRIPIPELRDCDKVERAKSIRELSKKVNLGPDALPSICFYTFLNSLYGVSSVEINEDSSLMSAGFGDSLIRIWPLNKNKLFSIKQADDLELLDKEADDINERMMDEKSASDSQVLYGHTGPVYATSFSPDKTQLVSASEDGTVRLWSLLSWSNLVSYRSHLFPVWSVKFSPLGHYFASAGYDRTARLWSTDHHQPLRIFTGHLSDVDCVEFHPNCNYIATGSSDRTVRLWDVLNGNCVRIMTGHKDMITILKFSADGRYLASGGKDKQIIIWDISSGDPVYRFTGHNNSIFSLSLSRDNTMLASGGRDNIIKLWDISKLSLDTEREVVPSQKIDCVSSKDGAILGSFSTKSSPILCLHFTRRNLLLAAGPYIN